MSAALKNSEFYFGKLLSPGLLYLQVVKSETFTTSGSLQLKKVLTFEGELFRVRPTRKEKKLLVFIAGFYPLFYFLILLKVFSPWFSNLGGVRILFETHFARNFRSFSKQKVVFPFVGSSKNDNNILYFYGSKSLNILFWIIVVIQIFSLVFEISQVMF